MKNALSVILFIILNTLISFSVEAQDTIVFKDKQRLIVVVKEVSPTEVQYKKIENPDGPTYVNSKNDIEKIIYKNGYVEVMKMEAIITSTPTQPAQDFVVYKAEENRTLEKITYDDTKKRYYHLTSLIDRHPDLSKKEPLTKLALNIKTLKRGRDATRTCAIIFGGIAVAGGALYGALSSVGAFDSSSGEGTLFAGPPIIWGSAAVILGGASIAVNINLKKKRQDFVNLYNQ